MTSLDATDLMRPRRVFAPGTRMLSSADVDALLDWDGLIARLERVHRDMSAGRALQPTPHPLRDPGDPSFDGLAVVPMLGYDLADGVFAVKVLADQPRNRDVGEPAQQSTVSLFDASSGACIGLVDGAALTRRRTAAATALATRALAAAEANVVTLVGAGALAVEHAQVFAHQGSFAEIRIWSRSHERARLAAGTVVADDVRVRAVPKLDEALVGAGVICTLTPSKKPLFAISAVTEGAHINAVGSPPRAGYRELAHDVFAAAEVVAVDSRGVALDEAGNIRHAIAAEVLSPNDLVELGDVLDGRSQGRTGPGQLTVFNSVGIGLQDLAAGVYALERARARGVGAFVDIRS